MRVLRLLKLLVVQCTAAGGSSSRALRLRRRRSPLPKKLYAFKFRRPLCRGECSRDVRPPPSAEENKGLLMKQRLVDLFADSPLSEAEEEEAGGGGGGCCGDGGGRWVTPEVVARHVGGRGWRFGTGLRCRLLRRPWRPMLLAIPESG